MLVEQINRHLHRYKSEFENRKRLSVVVPIESAKKRAARIMTTTEQAAVKDFIVCGVKLPIEVHQALTRRVQKGHAKSIKQGILDVVIRDLIDCGELKR